MMAVKLLLLTICEVCEGVTANGSQKLLKNKWAKFFSIDLDFTYTGVTPDSRILFS